MAGAEAIEESIFRGVPVNVTWLFSRAHYVASVEAVLQEFKRGGADDATLAARLQREGAEAFVASWHALLARIEEKSKNLA